MQEKEVIAMKKKFSATRLALWATRASMAAVVISLPLLPKFLLWYRSPWPQPQYSNHAIAIAYYCCAVFALLALWSMDKLLRNILGGEVFVRDNVRGIRRIQLCCGIISLICLPAALFYLPLTFMVIIMAFLFLVVWVVAQVMDAAVTIREENELTI